jgi:lipopolysaccharide transport system ATP-binding protein
MSTVISVENVSKAYRLGQIGGGTLKEDVSRWWAKLRGKPDPFLKIGEEHHARHMGEQFWALDNVSFEVKQGEVLGIIGRNGAGKSTLLKILSQVTTPTSGQIKIKGRIASLLEVGTGFNPEMTGRENVFLNGAILGMTKAEIRKKFDEIVAFSEIEEFIDTPVKRYSSGMYVRLAFAVAAHLEPEILICDEVLAVGDTEFQKKCIGKMQDVSKGGRTVLFVSHNMTAVSSLCDRAILLQSGHIIQQGEAAAVIDGYFGNVKNFAGLKWEGPVGDDNVEILQAHVLEGKEGQCVLKTDIPIIIELELKVLRPVYGFVLGWEIWSQNEQLLAYSLTDDSQLPPTTATQPGHYTWHMEIPANTLAAGSYDICLDVGIHNVRRIVSDKSICLKLNIENSAGIGRRYLTNSWTNIFRPAWRWTCAVDKLIATY